ncbi:MAG: GNAT family N-acetyltransferase [Sulfurimonas sp.]|jgi:Leucine-rich repeat (LRR) protein/ribosomal protein S18 acetylase RimI-like enzyme
MYDYEWDRLRTWLSQYGAMDESVTAPQEIKRIDLRGNSLKTLPNNFALLSHLSVLDIRRNSFEVLPEVLQSLPLLSLNASGNRLSDISILGACKHLRVLDLSANALKEIKISLLPELRTLNLSSNFLKDIGDFLPSFANVVRLNLGNNLIEHIPESIGLLQELEEIEIVDNRLQIIDEAFFQLALTNVNLSSNRLTSLELHGLTALEVLTLDENPLKTVGMSKDFAPYLKEFSCDGCALEEFVLPPSIELETLCLSSNSLKEIPKEIEIYKQLCELDIEANFITDLPDTLANITTLQTLYVKGNPLNPHAKKVIEILDPEICDLNMKSGITIETAIEEDLSEMAELLGILFAIESDFSIDYEKQYSGLKQLFAYEGSDLLVAKHENRVVGMLTMQRLISSAEGNFVGQLEDLVVKDEYRKMGVGSRLINKMRAKAIEYGYKRIQLAADINNENALKFYTRRGLKRTHLSIYHYLIP